MSASSRGFLGVNTDSDTTLHHHHHPELLSLLPLTPLALSADLEADSSNNNRICISSKIKITFDSKWYYDTKTVNGSMNDEWLQMN